MHLDVNTLNNFYYHTRLGQFTKRKLQECVQKIWGQSFKGPIAGFGFTPPILSLFLDQPNQIICLMPGQQGVMSWPSGKHNFSALVLKVLKIPIFGFIGLQWTRQLWIYVHCY